MYTGRIWRLSQVDGAFHAVKTAETAANTTFLESVHTVTCRGHNWKLKTLYHSIFVIILLSLNVHVD